MKTTNEIIEQKDSVLDFLKYNKNTFTNSKQIMKNIPSLKHGSYVRKVINLLRRDGYPIISNNSGYQYTTDIKDVAMYTQSLKCRIDDMMKAYNGMMNYIYSDLYTFTQNETHQHLFKR